MTRDKDIMYRFAEMAAKGELDPKALWMCLHRWHGFSNAVREMREQQRLMPRIVSPPEPSATETRLPRKH